MLKCHENILCFSMFSKLCTSTWNKPRKIILISSTVSYRKFYSWVRTMWTLYDKIQGHVAII
jgi:Rad3-related DNA helicase